MADKGKWFKLHIGWDDDPHIDALTLEDQARWCKFATYMKEHGTEGQITLIPPARVLQNKFQLISFDAVLEVLKRFPNLDVGEKQNVTVTGVTNVTVTFKNWHRYQGDFSGDRVRKFRANVTAKKRREEKRGEERRTTPIVPKGTGDQVLVWFEKTWAVYPKERRVGKKASFRSYQKDVKTLEDAQAILRALEIYQNSETYKTGYVRNASTFFANWRDYADDGRSSQGVYRKADDGRTSVAPMGSGVETPPPHDALKRLADSKAIRSGPAN